MAPLAQALKNYGHEVSFATGAGFGPVLQRLGFQHSPCGFDFDGSVYIFEALPEWETIKKKMPSGPAQQLCGFVEGLAPKMADDLLKLGNTWRPDLLVRDPVEFGGYIAAEAWRLPHVTVTWAVYIAAS
jgi:N-glycosyltransferase